MFFIQINKIKGAVQKSYHSPEGGGAVCVIKPYSISFIIGKLTKNGVRIWGGVRKGSK